MNIFGFLPKYGQVSLVNKRFYGVVCKVNDSKICLHIDDRMDSKLLQSMKISNREISSVLIEGNDNHFKVTDEILSVLETFSSTIKILKLVFVDTDELTFGKIFSLTPNIVRLDLYGIAFNSVQQSSKKPRCNDDYNLKNLKSLTIIRCDKKVAEVVNHLPVEVLTELDIACQWNTMTAALTRQSNVRKLVLGYADHGDDKLDQLALDIFDKVKLESLEVRPWRINKATIAEQTTLKSLVVIDENLVDVRVVNSIASLSELEKLETNITGIPVASIRMMLKLKKLQNLLVQYDAYDGTDELQALIASDNTSIKTMSLKWQAKMSADFMYSLAKSLPNLNHFNVLPRFINSAGIWIGEQQLHQIMCHFNFVTTLSIVMRGDRLVEGANYYNPKLRELSVYDTRLYLFNECLTQLIAAYPNLTKLKLEIFLVFPATLAIGPILYGLTALESLIVTSDVLPISDLDCLLEHRDNLKLVSLGYLGKSMLTDEMIRKLRVNFGLVNVSNDKILNVAVDRYTMSRECDLISYYRVFAERN